VTSHVALPGSDWAIWREVVLRAPGFPANGVDRLAAPLAAAAADQLAADGPDAGEEGWSSYRAVYAGEVARISSVIQELAVDPQFQRAVAWQNQRVLNDAIAPLLRNGGDPARRNHKHRDREDLVVNYWQRYCVKNDTIGFFGPVGWATLDAAAPHTRLEPGPGLMASSEVYFETWAMDRLADAITAEPGLSAWIAPRKRAFVRLDGQRAVSPATPPAVLSPAEMAVLRRCDGTVLAHDIARALAGTDPEIPAADDVYAVITRLVQRRLVTWKLELPVGPHPERALRRFLGQVGDPASATRGLAMLDRLEECRAEVRAADSADAASLAAALRALDSAFTTMTDTPATRNAGKAYGSRTLLYLDSRRDAELVLGADFATALAPIGLLLHSARWLTWQVRTELKGPLEDIAARLATRLGGPVDLATFWFECMTVLHKTAPVIVARLAAEFQRRWAAILRCDPGRSLERREASELWGPVADAFPAPRSGWAGGRYVSPDVMICAPSVEAMRCGDFELVVGELHLALATSRQYLFVAQHPSPQDLFDCVDIDNPAPQLLPVLPKEGPGRLTARTSPGLGRDADFLVALFDQAVDPARPRLLAAADLTIAPAPGGLAVTVPDGPSYDVMDVFSEIITNMLMDQMTIFPAAPHVPRVSIDRLVVTRESWRFPVDELSFARERDEASRFLRARSWRSAHSLPRRIFVKCPNETKPFFVDFDGCSYVNLLVRSIRRLQARATPGHEPSIVITEMLPDSDGLWLTDQAGQRYTAELRLVAVDQRGPVPGDLTVGQLPEFQVSAPALGGGSVL
jgi:hypothetical protein